MTEEKANVEVEFTPESVLEAFEDDPFVRSLLGSPEEFAAYLNEAFDQSDRQALCAMFEDHQVELEIGGEASVREVTSFEEWSEQTGFNPEGKEA